MSDSDFREVLLNKENTTSQPAFWHISQDVCDAIMLLLEYAAIFLYRQMCFPSERTLSESNSSADEYSEEEEEKSHFWDKGKQFCTLLSE